MIRFLVLLVLFTTALSASAMDLTLDGFGSAFYGQSFNQNLRPQNSQNTYPDFTDYSLLGFNIHSKIDDSFSVAAQLIASGNHNLQHSDFTNYFEWGYLNYQTTEGTNVRAGRQRYPIFTASEFINQHHELPYRELPWIIYRLAPYSTFDGVSVAHAFDTSIGAFNVAAFGGSPVVDVTTQTQSPQYSNLIGARVNLEGDGWRVRLQASRAKAQGNTASTSTPANYPVSADNDYFSAGYRFDKYNIVSWGEYLYRRAPDGTLTTQGIYGGIGRGGYVLVGYHIGKLMPRYTYANANADLGYISSGNKTTTTHTFGVNYDVSPKVALKVEYEVDFIPTAQQGYQVVQPVGASDTSGNTVYAGADFVF